VKWPNDVLLAGKKIAGILLETRGDCLALGIGLNVNFTPGQIRAAVDGAATSLAIELRRRLSREAVFQRLRTELENGLAAYTARGLPALLAEWRLHDALRGCAIAVESAGTTVRGRYRGLDAEGCLCLSDSRGRLRTFWAGDVTRILTRRLPEGAHKLRLGTRRAKVAEHESGRSEKDKPEIRPALTARVRSGNARPRWRPCSPNPRR
jgi:biotin-(acetyl-CoA carboxylase) ligase